VDASGSSNSGPITSTETFLKTTDAVSLVNTGNKDRVFTYTRPANILGKMFTSFEPKPQVLTTEEGTEWQWEFYFAVGEERSITIVENYRSLLYLALLILAGFAGYYLFRSPVVLKKSAMVIERREGGISEVKILIELKNRSKRSMSQVSVIDKIPSLATLSKTFEIGTLTPTKITHDASGNTLAKWTIAELDSLEERMLTYKIRTKYSILGSLKLPVCVSKFHSATGRKSGTKSNITQIGFGK